MFTPRDGVEVVGNAAFAELVVPISFMGGFVNAVDACVGDGLVRVDETSCSSFLFTDGVAGVASGTDNVTGCGAECASCDSVEACSSGVSEDERVMKNAPTPKATTAPTAAQRIVLIWDFVCAVGVACKT